MKNRTQAFPAAQGRAPMGGRPASTVKWQPMGQPATAAPLPMMRPAVEPGSSPWGPAQPAPAPVWSQPSTRVGPDPRPMLQKAPMPAPTAPAPDWANNAMAQRLAAASLAARQGGAAPQPVAQPVPQPLPMARPAPQSLPPGMSRGMARSRGLLR